MTRQLVFIFIVGLSCTLNLRLYAQSEDWRSHLEQLAEDGLDEETIENMFQDLSMLENNPMNLNSVTRDQLERFPLLNYEQATGLSDFLEKNRPIFTVFELRNVSWLDFNTVELILPFFYVGEMEMKEPTVKEMVKRGRNEIQGRFDKTLNQRAGYGEFSDSILQRYPNRKYRGEDFYHSLKYAFTYRDKVQLGILGEKDSGEPFMKKNYPRGYDHYGFHLIVRDIGNLKTLAIGDYRLSFGQGLILNNDFMISKSWATNNVIRRTIEPKRHFSTAENGFFRGIAAVYQISKVNITAFYSNKKFDANLSADGNMTSFKTDGYHRTPLEIEKKNNSHEQVAGINFNFRKDRFQAGVSAIYHQYDRTLFPSIQEYNIYYLRDSSNYNASIDYSYRFSRGVIFAGETAISKNGAVATTNMIQYSPGYNFSLTALHRKFPVTYNAMHSMAFSEGSRVQNENGFFLGASYNPVRKLSTTAYIDFFRFPWVKSQVDKPSKGSDIYFLGNYAFTRNSNFELRYKYKQKEENARYPDDNSRIVLPYNTQKLRLRYNQSLKTGWNFRTTIDAAFYHKRHFQTEKGFMFSQGVGYKGNSKLSGDLYTGYFKSDSYNARLYSYERNILSTFYMPSFYGEGLRLALSGRYQILPNLSLSAKIGYSRYFDRDTIGSGTEMISGNSRTDVFTYLRWRF